MTEAVWAAGFLPEMLNVLLLASGILLIGLVLIQQGKGGGLAGALGGAGGSSAFGARTGDTFTKITIYTAAVWVLLIMFLIKLTQPIETSGGMPAAGQQQSQDE